MGKGETALGENGGTPNGKWSVMFYRAMKSSQLSAPNTSGDQREAMSTDG